MTDPKLTQEEREQLIQASAVGQWFQQEREAREAAEAKVKQLETDLAEARHPSYQAWLASSEHGRLEAKVAELEKQLNPNPYSRTYADKMEAKVAELEDRLKKESQFHLDNENRLKAQRDAADIAAKEDQRKLVKEREYADQCGREAANMEARLQQATEALTLALVREDWAKVRSALATLEEK